MAAMDAAMAVTVRPCVEADEPRVESDLSLPGAATTRQLFGLSHVGALIETSYLTLCAETDAAASDPAAADPASEQDAAPPSSLLGFAAFDDKVPVGLAQWPEVVEYLTHRLLFGRPNGCVLLTAFRHSARVDAARVLTPLLHALFATKPELGGVVLAVPVGVPVEELGLFDHAFSLRDAVTVPSGALLRFFRAVRADYAPAVFIRQAVAESAGQSDAERLEPVVAKALMQTRLQDGAAFHAWFRPQELPTAIASQSDRAVCLVAESAASAQLGGVLACSDAVDADQVDVYGRLFGDLYRAGPTPTTMTAATTATTTTTTTPTGGRHQPLKALVLGPTGSGKGTQCALLAHEFGAVHVSAGELLRAQVRAGTDVGAKAKPFMDRGALVPDALATDLVLARLADADVAQRGWLLDGFPRTETQARVLAHHGFRLDVVVVLGLEDEQALQRLAARRAAPSELDPPVDATEPTSSRDRPALPRDDEARLIRTRLGAYREQQEAVLEPFMKTAAVVKADAARSVRAVQRKLALELYRARGLRPPMRLRRPPKLVIAGPPAGGKGTQCEWLVRAFGVVHLSTGDMLRASIAAGAPLGMQAKAFMDAGELVPDALVVDVVLERLQQPDCQVRGWLLDGFPRTKSQAEAMAAKGVVPDCVLVLDVPDEEVVARISGRLLDPETGATYHRTARPPPSEEVAARCVTRSDDTAETARTRLRSFHDNWSEVVGVLGGACEVVEADGTRAIEQVADAFLGAVERCLLRNNCVAISMFSMASELEARAHLFLPKVFAMFPDKDCLVLCLPERCARVAITAGFRTAVGDPNVSTTSRILSEQQKQQQPDASSANRFVLYALHRDDVPFTSTGLQDLSGEQVVRKAVPVVIKGVGFGRRLQLWGERCLGLVGVGRSRPPKAKKKKKDKPARQAITAISTKSTVQDAPPDRNSQ